MRRFPLFAQETTLRECANTPLGAAYLGSSRGQIFHHLGGRSVRNRSGAHRDEAFSLRISLALRHHPAPIEHNLALLQDGWSMILTDHGVGEKLSTRSNWGFVVAQGKLRAED